MQTQAHLPAHLPAQGNKKVYLRNRSSVTVSATECELRVQRRVCKQLRNVYVT